VRWEVLCDNRRLFAVRPLPVLLTGVAAILIGDQVVAALAPLRLPLPALESLVALAQAGMVAGVVGIALWRAVVHAAATKSVLPTGIGTGLWLGAGMVAAELIRERIYDFQWLPSHLEVLGLLVVGAVVFCWWTARCAAMWISVWPGAGVAWAAALVLVGGALVLATWLHWWQSSGTVYVNGGLISSAGVLDKTLEDLRVETTEPPLALKVFAVSFAPFIAALNAPLVWAALLAMLVVPLLTWLPRTDGSKQLWIERQSGVVLSPSLPRLRRILLAALVGGAACTAVMIAASLFEHRQTGAEATALRLLIYSTWLIASGIAAGAAAAACTAAWTRPHRLPVAIAAALLSLPIGAAGVAGLLSADGCVGATSVFVRDCGAVPVADVALSFLWVLPSAAVAAVAGAMVAVAVGSVAGRAGSPAMPRPSATGARWRIARRLTVATTCVAAVALIATVGWENRIEDPVSDVDASNSMGILRTDDAPVGPELQALQLVAWNAYGGADLIERLLVSFEALTAVLASNAEAEPLDGGRVQVDEVRLRPLCEELGRVAADAREYFSIPDAAVQETWSVGLDRTESASSLCVVAIDTDNGALIDRALVELLLATESLATMAVEFTALLEARTTE
jgi:hypothetical protein